MTNVKYNETVKHTTSDADLEGIAGGLKDPYHAKPNREQDQSQSATPIEAVAKELEEWDRIRHPAKCRGGGYDRGALWYPGIGDATMGSPAASLEQTCHSSRSPAKRLARTACDA